MIDLREEMREDMMREAREEEFTDNLMSKDIDYFLEQVNAVEIVKEIQAIIKTAEHYGYERDDVIEYIKDNIWKKLDTELSKRTKPSLLIKMD